MPPVDRWTSIGDDNGDGSEVGGEESQERRGVAHPGKHLFSGESRDLMRHDPRDAPELAASRPSLRNFDIGCRLSTMNFVASQAVARA